MSATIALRPSGMMPVSHRAMPVCKALPIRESVLGQDTTGEVSGEGAFLIPLLKAGATWLIGGIAWYYAEPYVIGAIETAYHYDGSGGGGHYGQEALMAEVYDHISDYDEWLR